MLVLLLFSILVAAILALAALAAFRKPPPRFQWSLADLFGGTLLAASIFWTVRSCSTAYEIYGAVGSGLVYAEVFLLAVGVSVA